MKKYLTASLVMHLLILLSLFSTFRFEIKKTPTEIINIDFKEIEKKKATHGTPESQTKSSPKEDAPRLGSDQYYDVPRDLGERAAAEHYLERLREHIEPNWITILDQIFNSKKHKPRPCLVRLNIDADAKGTVLKIVIIESCGWKIAEDAAIKAIEISGILPPPKEYLINGIFYLQWYFDLKVI